MIPRTLILIALVALASVAGGPRARANTTEPVACDIQPRTEEEVAALLAATPVVTEPPMTAPGEWPPAGAPVDDATRADLQHTLDLAEACAAGGDLYRLYALYSDAYLRTSVLAEEPVPIVPATPAADDSAPGTPASGDDAPTAPQITDAVRTPSGRVAALTTLADGQQQIVWFVQEAERWRIDGIEPFTPPQPEAVAMAVLQIATLAGVDPAEVTVIASERIEWPDASLGCPEPGMVYAQVITPGWRIEVEIAGERIVYHADESGSRVVTCAEA